MGKVEGTGNRPTNASLSYTMNHLVTEVSIAALPKEATEDRWRPLVKPGFGAPALSETGRAKFLNHFRFLKETWGVPGFHEIASANNFPSDCGLASSASSFAALTKAAARAFGRGESAEELSRLSRRGSGSSCRSFFSPWALWREEGAESVDDLGFGDLLHAAVVVSAGMKQVSSSEAHRRVLSSPKFAGRPERAEQRLRELMSALREKNWAEAHRVTWDEFVDMHELFETSQPAFGYRNRASKDVVDACRHIWSFKNDGPLVTMDAGPNVHLLFRPDQRELADKMVTHFQEKHVVMSSWRGLK
ncbi:MAG: diphosphomevalonate decarboxylase [Bdellovibrionaceae bacterium]|nr:diphosphomevalonate decarboxylase [Pseudobdellovibrionaceae bacterium]